jgi:hypothetical protein
MKYEITDKAAYTTVYFTVECEDGREYRVSIVEDDWHDNYQVMDENGNEIEPETELYKELVTLCEIELNK